MLLYVYITFTKRNKYGQRSAKISKKVVSTAYITDPLSDMLPNGREPGITV